MKNKTKMCTKCGKRYPATKEYFYVNNSSLDGLCFRCSSCAKEDSKRYRQNNPLKVQESKKKNYIENREEILKNAKVYRQENKEARKEYNKQYILTHKKEALEYRVINKEKIKEYKKTYWRQYYPKHANELREKQRVRNHNNRDRAREYRIEHRQEINEYNRNRRKTDVKYRILQSLRKRLCETIKSQGAVKSAHTIELVGCTIKKLLRHIESQFDDKMTWDNYGVKGWHIDHIKPCASFDLTKPEEQRKCFNYKNLQPLWWPDNFKKNAWYKGKLYRKRRETCPR